MFKERCTKENSEMEINKEEVFTNLETVKLMMANGRTTKDKEKENSLGRTEKHMRVNGKMTLCME